MTERAPAEPQRVPEKPQQVPAEPQQVLAKPQRAQAKALDRSRRRWADHLPECVLWISGPRLAGNRRLLGRVSQIFSLLCGVCCTVAGGMAKIDETRPRRSAP
jgi:hypothetical protein